MTFYYRISLFLRMLCGIFLLIKTFRLFNLICQSFLLILKRLPPIQTHQNSSKVSVRTGLFRSIKVPLMIQDYSFIFSFLSKVSSSGGVVFPIRFPLEILIPPLSLSIRCNVDSFQMLQSPRNRSSISYFPAKISRYQSGGYPSLFQIFIFIFSAVSEASIFKVIVLPAGVLTKT